jgi:hypothetical protein
MVTRRTVLILGVAAPWLSACSGGDGSRQNLLVPHHPIAPDSPNLPNQGTYGRKIASWNQIQETVGARSVLSTDLPPFADGATRVLNLSQSNNLSTAEQSPIDGNEPYLPKSGGAGFSAGIWAKNTNARTLNFELSIHNSNASHYVKWNCAIEPARRWTFLTLSPTQQIAAGWIWNTDAINLVRVSQQDHMAEGAWLPGEYLLFGNVYVEVASRPLFLITFDDGFDSQRNPNLKPIQSGPAYVASTSANLLMTAANHGLIEGEPIVFTDVAPTGLQLDTKYWVSSVPSPASFALAGDESLGTVAITDGFVGAANYRFAGTPFRSAQQIVESYGFKGSLFLVPSWLGTTGVYGYGGRPNKFMSVADAKAMYAEGWSVGSHSNTHPSNKDNAGLRLLGPYGYFLSNAVDNLPASYVTAWGLGASNRRRAIGAAAGTDIISFENPHEFLVNLPIVFADVAPPGLSLGTTYYCQTIPTPTTATFATDQGSLKSRAGVAADWTGIANYRYAGSSNDDAAIFADIQAGIDGLAALGIATGAKFFALPQGSADQYVRSACIRAKLPWVRGASLHAHTIPVGRPSGGGLSGVANQPGGWLAQPDCVQTDARVAPPITAIKTYVDDTITQGACGCSYHHAVGAGTIANLDNICAYLRKKADAKAIDVVTLDEMAAALMI